MSKLHISEIKAFVPAKNFEHVSFLLQDYCAEGQAENFMMHMLVCGRLVEPSSCE